MPALMPATPSSRVSVSWLAASAAAATSTNLLNLLPRVVWYKNLADAAIRDEAIVMCVLALQKPARGQRFNTTGATRGGAPVPSGSDLGHGTVAKVTSQPKSAQVAGTRRGPRPVIKPTAGRGNRAGRT